MIPELWSFSPASPASAPLGVPETLQADCREPYRIPYVIDVKDPRNPRIIGMLPRPVAPKDAPYPDFCMARGRFGSHNTQCWVAPGLSRPNIMAIAWFNAGIRIFDLSNPTAPREVAWFVPPRDGDIEKYESWWRGTSENVFVEWDRNLIWLGTHEGTHCLQTTVEADKASRLQYLLAQSYDKLKDAEAARRTYQRLADGGGETPWASIGLSAVQLMDMQFDEALASSDRAVRMAAALPEAHYQRGIVLMFRKEYGDAVDAFTQATRIDPRSAAAYYYAGLANSRVKRIDLMANNFSMFIKLAPNAPERPEVESILRTVRGR